MTTRGRQIIAGLALLCAGAFTGGGQALAADGAGAKPQPARAAHPRSVKRATQAPATAKAETAKPTPAPEPSPEKMKEMMRHPEPRHGAGRL